MKESNFVAGAWVGEFGWELLCWQGHIRKLAQKYKSTKVYSRIGHNAIYSDFCTEYESFTPICKELNGFRCEEQENEFKYAPKEKEIYLDGKDFNIGFNYNGNKITDKSGIFFQQEFVKYGKNKGQGFDILLHIRKKCADRDWEYNKWIELANLLVKSGRRISTVGSLEMSDKIDGVNDMRGIPLKELSDVMASSNMIVGQSSGAMHFASLCGLKHLVWSSEFNRLKYLNYWNPFNTNVVFYSEEEWNPSPINICNLCQ